MRSIQQDFFAAGKQFGYAEGQRDMTCWLWGWVAEDDVRTAPLDPKVHADVVLWTLGHNLVMIGMAWAAESRGYSSGYSEGYTRGYSKGYDDGWYDG